MKKVLQPWTQRFKESVEKFSLKSVMHSSFAVANVTALEIPI